ncbi:MAG: serine/threonine protein kinase [Planctomycetes bacterium]|nr:serine/threonine protein kinase [Planctomycetota bacterium]
MTTPTPLPDDIYDRVVRAIVAYERDGDIALARELADAGTHAEAVRNHVEALRGAGLLQEPERPDRIGPYEVLQRLGSGGMGTVFLCQQESPVRRRVAVKVLRAGMDSAEILARFRLEQHTLARLEHPGIARLLDAGSTESGRPFLVLEYVAGLHLLRYCDDRQLDTRSRLELFAKVCDAVQHAHHKGVVHRDLKPSNVLVLDRDGAPWPMVIDFGVAKSIAGNADLRTLLTLPGAMLGTPEYMSPEQATHELDVDTRTDVYSLGVVLYELLTGTLPIERERLRRGEVARILSTTEPPTPSARITMLGASATTTAANRRTDVAGLRRIVRGDLDHVVMQALEKDRNRRYGTPAELAADVRRFLADQPVAAGPVSRWYRFRKLCARNRPQALAAGLALGTVVTGFVASTWFWRDAVASSRASDASLDDAMVAVGELVAVGDSDLVDVPHLATVRRGLLERSVAFYRRFVERAGDDARLQPRIAEALLRLGCLQAHLGDHATAVACLRDALVRAAKMPAESISVALHARGLDALAEAAEHLGDSATAVDAANRGEALLRDAFATTPSTDLRALWLRALLRCSHQRAPKDKDEAHRLARQARELADAFTAPDGGEPTHWPLAVDAGAGLARRLLDLGRRDEALRELDAAFALWQRTDRERLDTGVAWRLTLAVGEVAALLAACDDYGRMTTVLEDVEGTYARLATDHPAVAAYRTGLARTRLGKATALLKGYRFRDGINGASDAESDFAAALTHQGDDPTVLHEAAHAAVFLANAHLEARRQGVTVDLAKARDARARADERIERLAALPTGERSAQRLRIEERRLFALLHPTPGSAEATMALATAMTLADELCAADPNDRGLGERAVEMRLRYGQALRRGGEMQAAHAVLAPALATLQTLHGALGSNEVWILRHNMLRSELAHVAAALGDAEAVVEHLRARVGHAYNEDWGGKLEVARLLLQFAQGDLQQQAPHLLPFAREVVRLAVAAGDAYEKRGMPDGTPAMVAAMRANTWQLLVEIERLAGDARAEAAALGEVAACRAAQRRHSPGDSANAKCREACTAWLQRLVDVGDSTLLAAGGTWVAAHAEGDATTLLAAARVLAAAAARQPEADAVRTAGAGLLRAAVAAGAERAAIESDPTLQPLRDVSGH